MAVFFLVSFFCEMFCKKFLICAECVPTLAITVHGIASVSINILLGVINKMMGKKFKKMTKYFPKHSSMFIIIIQSCTYKIINAF